MSDFWATDNTEYDDNDVYGDSLADLNFFPAETPLIDSKLNINENAPATKAQGGTKSNYTPVPGGIALLDTGNESGCHFTVERPVWVDGWWETAEVDGKLEQKQPMTLVVLKFVLQTFDEGLRVRNVTATLQFKDANQERGDDPEVQAWAPFHDLEDWNPTKAEEKVTTNKTATASGGYNSSSLTLGWSKDREVSWDRTAFDEGRSILVKSKRKQRPIGVTWSLKQNKLENRGVSPIIWAAVLIKRKVSDSQYLVKFRLDVRTGTYRDLQSKSLEFLRMKPGATSSFKVTPNPGVWDDTTCFGEGEDIRESKIVDLNNLGKLVGKNRTTFGGSWGPQYRRPVSNATEAEHAEPATPLIATESPPPDNTRNIKLTLPLAASTPPVTPPVRNDLTHGESIPKTLVDPIAQEEPPLPKQPSYHPPQVATVASGTSSICKEADASSSRLVALETRAANAEARLATQELLLLQLKGAVDARDARLARIEQAMRVAAMALSEPK